MIEPRTFFLQEILSRSGETVVKRLSTWVLLPLLFALGPASQALAAVTETIVPATGRPTLTVKVSGSGFLANEAVDVYFDTTDEFLAFTNASGGFAAHDLTIPVSALPGTHWITAIGRKDGGGTQKSFVVRTAWRGWASTCTMSATTALRTSCRLPT